MIATMLSKRYTLGASGVWSKSDAPGTFNYSDGDEVESRILHLLSQARDLSLASDELQQLITDWPTEYHFSPLRSNLLSPFKLDQCKNILEVGSGCGAITRYLGEQCSNSDIIALEGSFRRAEITRTRCRDLTNVTVCCDSFADFEHAGPFDLITLIGVLEYSPSFFSGDNPFQAALTQARNLLAPDGTLVIAIENQLGLKYFNGCAEDHTGTPFTGINDLYQPGTVCTFGKRELEEQIKQAGFLQASFVYPFPDYKLPQLLLREASFNSDKLDLGYLTGQYRSRDYGIDGERVFHEGRVWSLLAKNGLLRDLANSFLVFASIEGITVEELSDPWLACSYSCRRKKRYLVKTVFSEDNGSMVVDKDVCYQPDNSTVETEPAHITHHVGRADYVEGVPYSYNLPFLLSRQGSLRAFINYLTPWFNWLREQVSLNRENGQDGASTIPGPLYDCLPSNFLIGHDKKLHIIDQEWEHTDALEPGFLLFRALYSEFSQNIALFEQSDLFDQRTVFDVSKAIFDHFNLPLNETILNKYIDEEIDFQLQVVVYNSDKKGLRTYLINFFNVARTQRFSAGDLLASRGVRRHSKLLNQKDMLDQEVTTLRERLAECNQLISSMHQSISWQLTEPLRFFGYLLRGDFDKVTFSGRKVRDSIRSIPRRLKANSINRQISSLNIDIADSAPYFSVIIPIYDRTIELREAINSVLSQTFKSFELLLICDGSPPETVEVVRSFAENPHVKTYFFQNNSGNPCRGRNKGIELSRGKFVAFLDSDDLALPNRLERTLFHILEKKVDIVGGAIKYLTEKEECRDFKNGQVGFTSEECTYDLLLVGNRLSICTVAVRKSCLSQYGAFRQDMRYREDYELWLRLAYNGCSFYNSPEVFAHYRVHENNAELLYLENDQYWFSKALELHRTK